jgi:hypothetical protein
MQLRAGLFATAVALASFGANCTPVYIPTTLSSAETCSRAVDWNGPKVTLNPPELTAAVTSPIVWSGFQSERQQFGYNPAFAPGPVSIAPNGRPILRDKNLTLWVLNDNGTWKTVSLFSAAEQSLQQQGHTWTTSPNWPGSPLFGSAAEQDRRVVFDQHCHAYTVVNAIRSSLGFAFLLHSRDGGRSWSAYALPGWTGDGDVRMEVPSSTKHRLSRPPVLVLHKHAFQAGPGSSAVLLFPKKRSDGTLDIGSPVTVADTVCCGSHSGNDTQVVTDGDLVHFAYPRATLETDPATGRIGTPQYVVTIRRSTGQPVWAPTLVGFGFDGPTGNATVANAHSQPALALDSAGFLHVIISGHDAEMKYRKSSAPHASTSWSAAEFVSLSPHTSTYPSLLLDALDQPHVISRWADATYRFLLVHRLRNAITNTWSTQNVLLNPGRSYKAEWYHKALIDPAGRLFVSYSYYPANLFADEATLFGNVWGFTLTKQNPACVSYNSSQPQPPATYCEYNGYTDVSPGVLLSWDNGTVFRPSTTPLFSQNPPVIEPHRNLYPLITSILSGN